MQRLLNGVRFEQYLYGGPVEEFYYTMRLVRCPSVLSLFLFFLLLLLLLLRLLIFLLFLMLLFPLLLPLLLLLLLFLLLLLLLIPLLLLLLPCLILLSLFLSRFFSIHLISKPQAPNPEPKTTEQHTDGAGMAGR